MHFLIKPVSDLCNMHCRYCFYEDETKNRSVKNLGILSREKADLLIREALSEASHREGVHFAFQGGEPTLAGVDFFQNFLESVSTLNTNHIPVSYSIQTNGLKLSDSLISLFIRHRFLVGISVDGTKVIHDANRIDSSHRGTWGTVTHNLHRLQQAGAQVNLLCVVTRACARSPQKVYNSLKKLSCRYLQFIACLDPMEEIRGCADYSLLPEDYGRFLCGLFDCWYQDWKKGDYVSIRLFDDFVHLAMGLNAGTCATSGSCGHYCVVEGDGSLYPCDFYAVDEWKLGTLGEKPLAQICTGEKAAAFLAQGRQRPLRCSQCQWQRLCGGGCKRDWVIEDGKTENYYCNAFQTFFAYAESRLLEIARAETLFLRKQYGFTSRTVTRMQKKSP